MALLWVRFNVYRRKYREDVSSAEVLLRRLVGSNPVHTRGLTDLGKLLCDTGKREEGVLLYQR